MKFQKNVVVLTDEELASWPTGRNEVQAYANKNREPVTVTGKKWVETVMPQANACACRGVCTCQQA